MSSVGRKNGGGKSSPRQRILRSGERGYYGLTSLNITLAHAGSPSLRCALNEREGLDEQMNATLAAGYGTPEKVALSLMGGLLVPLMGWFVFVVARRRLRQSDSLTRRGYLFYQTLAGVLLGQFMCHTWRGLGVDATYMFVFALLGCLVLHSAEQIGRLWNTNVNYHGPLRDDCDNDDYALERTHLEEQTMMVVNNVGSHQFASTMWRALDYSKQMVKRNWMMWLVVVVFSLIAVMDGLLLVCRNPQGETQVMLTVLAFYLNGCAMTVSVFGATLHSKWHVTEEHRAAWWTALTLAWAAILVASVVPVLANVSVETALSIISHRAFLAFYGLAAGAVLGLKEYYHRRNMSDIDRSEALWGEVVFWLAAGQAAVTAFWL